VRYGYSASKRFKSGVYIAHPLPRLGSYNYSTWLYSCSCYYAIAVPGSIIAVSSYMVAVMNSIVTAAKYIVAVASFIVAAAGFTVAAGNYEVGGRLFENEAGRFVISLASYRLYDGQLLTGHHPSKRDGAYLLVLGA
jgi:hypothetical protein